LPGACPAEAHFRQIPHNVPKKEDQNIAPSFTSSNEKTGDANGTTVKRNGCGHWTCSITEVIEQLYCYTRNGRIGEGGSFMLKHQAAYRCGKQVCTK
jgi:hypothetical protein